MKKIIIISLLFSIFTFTGSANADSIDSLTQRLKDCTDGPCKTELQDESEKIFDAAGKNFSEDFAAIGNDISIKHCQSIAAEIFYHMDKIKLYNNFKRVFYLKKLKRFKRNKTRFDNGEISNQDLARISKQIEDQYKHDIKESQDFIDHKVRRLKELCQNFQQNIKEINIPQNKLAERITYLRNDRTWQDFETNSAEGKKIITAINLSSNKAGKNLINCLKSMFYIAKKQNGGKVFSTGAVQNLKKNN